MLAVRPDGRSNDQLRPLRFTPGIAPNADGSVLIATGNTQVVCAATVEPSVPRWMKEQGVSGGWITAEYSMLPYSTLTRRPRDISKGRLDGRSVEIQRLIGRATSGCGGSRRPWRAHTVGRLRCPPGRWGDQDRIDYRRFRRGCAGVRRAASARADYALAVALSGGCRERRCGR